MATPDKPADIFVSIAAYDDLEIMHTVHELLTKGERSMRVALVWQSDNLEMLEHLRRYVELDLLHIPKEKARGACWPRAIAQSMWRGEPWYFQIDAHTRFEPGWDAELLRQIALLQGKPVITGYTANYGDEGVAQDHATVMCPFQFGDDGPQAHGEWWPLESFGGRPVKARMLSGHFLFAPSAWIQEVPYDPYLYFGGEEQSLAIRSWTHGWDLYHACKTVCYHQFSRPRPTHWGDDEGWWQYDWRSKRRTDSLYGWASGPDLGIYGMGSERTFDAFQAWSGFDYADRTFTSNEEWYANR